MSAETDHRPSFATLVEIAFASVASAASWTIMEDFPLSMRLLILLIGIAGFLCVHFGTYSQRYRRRLYGLGIVCCLLLVGVSYFAVQMKWREQARIKAEVAEREAIRDKLAKFMSEAATMQGVCEDNTKPIPNVGLWKSKVEAYLRILGPSYVPRFEQGYTDMYLPGLEGQHEACWADLHTRDRNLNEFFADFRPIPTTE
jgi:hypothetical protein